MNDYIVYGIKQASNVFKIGVTGQLKPRMIKSKTDNLENQECIFCKSFALEKEAYAYKDGFKKQHLNDGIFNKELCKQHSEKFNITTEVKNHLEKIIQSMSNEEKLKMNEANSVLCGPKVKFSKLPLSGENGKYAYFNKNNQWEYKIRDVDHEIPEYRIITPEIAKDWLENRNNLNRDNSISAEKTLAEKMKTGEWGKNNDMICFEVAGNLLNGQTRLAASVESNTDLKCTVAFNYDRDDFFHMDKGRKRTAHHDYTSAGLGLKPRESSSINLLCDKKKEDKSHDKIKKYIPFAQEAFKIKKTAAYLAPFIAALYYYAEVEKNEDKLAKIKDVLFIYANDGQIPSTMSKEVGNTLIKGKNSIENAVNKKVSGRLYASTGNGIDEIYFKLTNLLYRYANNDLPDEKSNWKLKSDVNHFM